MFAGERASSVNACAQDLIVGANKFKKFCRSAEELLTNGGAEFGEIGSRRSIGGERDGLRAEGKNCGAVRNFARKTKCTAFGDVVSNNPTEKIRLADELGRIGSVRAGVDFAR